MIVYYFINTTGKPSLEVFLINQYFTHTRKCASIKTIHMLRLFTICITLQVIVAGCSKSSSPTPEPPVTPPVVPSFNLASSSINNVAATGTLRDIPLAPLTRFTFNRPVNRATTSASVSLRENSSVAVAYAVSYEKDDSVLIVQPSAPLKALTRYSVVVSTALQSVAGKNLAATATVNFITKIDSSNKFTVISDNALLDLVQKQTFKYFWEFGHPASGMARERNNSGETITSGGSGFGIMAIPVAINRNFITKAEGLARMQKIVAFLKTTAQTFHGAYPHWLNGTNGIVIPFGNDDNGADLVETSYLMQGLLTVRQYFNTADPAEIALRSDINIIFNRVEWDWFRKANENVLYWHWSPDQLFNKNFQVKGWNECLVTYVLAASSTTHGVPPPVYTDGWASNGGMVNGNSYYGLPLPLGPELGGPLFFEQYSFLGINPTALTDAYANYEVQTKNHTLINYNYCVDNPKDYFGYSDQCWGLTASDIPNGYTASSPTNDVGVIAPTAALSSFPYTPAESMKALKFYYYILGDKLWKEYGFVDAFSLHELWFADSFLAIDQGPIVGMIENYRSGLLWDLFTSCSEVKTGMKSIGFTAPYLN
jgi:hypothetical protein